MDNANNGAPRRPNPRRKRRSRFQKIVRAYYPVAIVLALVVLFIIFATNSVKRANEKREQARQESLAAEASLAQVQKELEQEAVRLVKEADQFADSCEFDKALAMLDTFSGNPDDFDVIKLARDRYKAGDDSLIPVEDFSQIKCLSFGRLVPDKDFFIGDNGESNRMNYITVAEFNRILQGLYDGGYMLIDIHDLYTTGKNEDGTTRLVKNDLRLPQGKKPVMLINAQPAGYSGQLTLDGDGNIVMALTEYTVGSYDFVPALEDFIRSNPGFSYKGSRAILALTAHNGLFGYELTETAQITKVAQALTEQGYVLACNTFGNAAYGLSKVEEINEDISNWNISAVPLIGQTELLVYARSSDIYDGKDSYFGKKYEALYGHGFRYYFGICYNSNPWMDVTENTFRMGRIIVDGDNLINKPAFYEGLFDPEKVLE